MGRQSAALIPQTASADDGVSPLAPAKFAVHVLATTPEGTRSALAAARRLTNGLDAKLVLLVPRLNSRISPFDPTTQERAAIIDAHRAIAADVGVHVTPLFCVGLRLEDVIHQLVGRSSLVIVGGRRNRLWPSSEQRLVDRLTAEGYPVVLAPTTVRRPPLQIA